MKVIVDCKQFVTICGEQVRFLGPYINVESAEAVRQFVMSLPNGPKNPTLHSIIAA